MNLKSLFLSAALLASGAAHATEPFTVLDIWPNQPPGPAREIGEEKDFTKPTDKLIAGRRIIKLGNVSTPQIHVYRPDPAIANGTSVIICPGGGFSILAWDLEGTEVAEYLNSIGVTAIVLKYRVPTREQEPMWLAPLQDTQRAIRLTRHHADSWKLDPNRIGVLGFSAGGKTAAMAALIEEANYESTDAADKHAVNPNFAVLIYPAWLAKKDNSGLAEDVIVTDKTPPMFFAHAFDDRVRVENSLYLCLALKQHNIPAELHIYSEGRHGYGLRPTKQPVTSWSKRCTDWMRVQGWLTKKNEN